MASHNSVPSFIFGRNTGVNSQSELERTRGIVEALMARSASRVPQKYPWEGINSLTRSLVARQLGERADPAIKGVIEANAMHPDGKELYRIMDMWFLAEDLIVG